MRIQYATHAGFCFGVKRAVSGALSLAKEGHDIVTLGDLIHNTQFISHLAQQGIHAVEDVDGVQDGQTVVIRAHGVPPAVYEGLEARGLTYHDLTCPFVKRIHGRVKKVNDDFDTILIVGEREHPEVIGICGWAGKKADVISSVAQARELAQLGRVLVVAQTTLPIETYDTICAVLMEKVEELERFDSICETTILRQEETAKLAKMSDAVVVIGDKNSSNSRKLYHIAKQHCKKVDFIEQESQLLLENYANCDIISVVAGASAPDWIIREVRTRMSELEKTQVTEENTAPVEAEETVAEVSADQPAPEVQEEVTEEPVAEEAVAEEAAPVEEPAEPTQEEAPVMEEVTEVPAQADEATPVAEEAAEEEEEEPSFEEQLEKTFIRIRRGQFVKGTVVHVTEAEVCLNIGYKADGLIRKENLTTAGDVSPLELFQPGDEVEAEVLSLNDGEGNVVLSRKKIEGLQKWREFVDALDMDAMYEAKVTRVIKGGVLARFSEYDAFIPASQLSLKYVEDLSIFVDQTIPVKIIDVDKRQKRFVLSNKEALKEHLKEQEKMIFESFEKGSVVRGVVKRLTDFGAFVDVGGVDGLLHITDISWTRIKHPKDILEENQEIDVKILNVDPEKKKVSLGYKQLQPRPWDLVPEKYNVGDVIEGKVVRIAPFGAFVELEPTVDGLVHISQVVNRRIEKVEDVLTLGQTVKVKVLEVNAEKRRISLSMKALLEPESGAGGDSDGRPRGRRQDRGGSYTLPPMEEATTSLADLFQSVADDLDEEE